ncbi:hypothetical protein L3Q82_003706 [Scortum barcoo]|uniref:Uncharacterized protein n=1 Tax=Scortum barcoo TaxID=214431 RepID=A0ACB8X798_9TELE|nr:hypothetical protein L3Q82_003706 [Scortum barcoo]
MKRFSRGDRDFMTRMPPPLQLTYPPGLAGPAEQEDDVQTLRPVSARPRNLQRNLKTTSLTPSGVTTSPSRSENLLLVADVTTFTKTTEAVRKFELLHHKPPVTPESVGGASTLLLSFCQSSSDWFRSTESLRLVQVSGWFRSTESLRLVQVSGWFRSQTGSGLQRVSGGSGLRLVQVSGWFRSKESLRLVQVYRELLMKMMMKMLVLVLVLWSSPGSQLTSREREEKVDQRPAAGMDMEPSQQAAQGEDHVSAERPGFRHRYSRAWIFCGHFKTTSARS